MKCAERERGIPEEAADLERYLNTDNIVVHVHTEKKNSTERVCLMVKEGEEIIVRRMRSGISQRA